MAPILIDNSIPLYTRYFHALSSSDNTDIFKTATSNVQITFRQNFEPYDIVDKMIKPLQNASRLKEDSGDLLVPLEGLLYLPDSAPSPKFPLLIIAHGNHAADFSMATIPPIIAGQKAKKDINLLPNSVLSYQGYIDFQDHLAQNGIASYSINLNIVNDLENNEAEADFFKKLALDSNQRIMLLFLHLKLLKMIAGEPISIAGPDPLPIKLRNGSSWVDLDAALQNPASNPTLLGLKTTLTGKIDFARLGLMGHSRGADAVTRTPIYFFNGGSVPDHPPYHFHPIVNDRIKILSEQVGKPTQDLIKSILALQPGAVVNPVANIDANNQGYVVDNPTTMYFVGVGTHDEEVSFDSVRIYEYPTSSKAMVAVNGASHKRFNTVWARDETMDEFGDELQPTSLLTLGDHGNILREVFGRCFTSTLGGQAKDLDYFNKKASFVVPLAQAFDFQMAWKFGIPVQANVATLNNLTNITDVPTSDPASHSSFKFEQHLTAFYVEKTNEGNFIIKIPIDPSGSSKLSNYTHFSFRFGKGYSLSSSPDRVEEKNFTIQMFENNSALGNIVEGRNITTIELKALRVLHARTNTQDKIEFKHSILLQTAEIELTDCCQAADLKRVNRIEITIIPDKTKAAPPSTGEVVFGSAAGAVFGAGIGVTGGLVFALLDHVDPDNRDKIMLWSAVGGAGLGGYIGYRIFKADTNAFVFTDFLLTHRT